MLTAPIPKLENKMQSEIERFQKKQNVSEQRDFT